LVFAGAGTTLVTPGLAADRRPSRAEPSPSRPTARSELFVDSGCHRARHSVERLAAANELLD
jgi:hypothetical protein